MDTNLAGLLEVVNLLLLLHLEELSSIEPILRIFVIDALECLDAGNAWGTAIGSTAFGSGMPVS